MSEHEVRREKREYREENGVSIESKQIMCMYEYLVKGFWGEGRSGQFQDKVCLCSP